MPEGPEIRLAADEVEKALINREVEAVFFAFDHLKPHETHLQGTTVTAVETYGKAILTRFSNGLNIYSHNQLYGRWVIRTAYDYPETNRQLRLAIHNHKQSALLYSASEIEVLPDDEISEHPFISRLGPDLLRPEVDLAIVEAQFNKERFSGRGLTSLLLDQGFLAGVGNYLRSEILFVAQVHPSLRPQDCSPAQRHALAKAALSLTQQSYKTKGITNNLDLAQELKGQGYSYRHYRFWVFGREDEPCFKCATPIIKETMGGRRLYYCPVCQAT